MKVTKDFLQTLSIKDLTVINKIDGIKAVISGENKKTIIETAKRIKESELTINNNILVLNGNDIGVVKPVEMPKADKDFISKEDMQKISKIVYKKLIKKDMENEKYTKYVFLQDGKALWTNGYILGLNDVSITNKIILLSKFFERKNFTEYDYTLYFIQDNDNYITYYIENEIYIISYVYDNNRKMPEYQRVVDFKEPFEIEISKEELLKNAKENFKLENYPITKININNKEIKLNFDYLEWIISNLTEKIKIKIDTVYEYSALLLNNYAIMPLKY